MKKWVRKTIGDENYIKLFGYISDIYQSVFLPIKEEGTDLVRRIIQPGDVVFDIGANVGRFTSLAAGLTGRTGCVVAFEPQAQPRRILTQMRAFKGLDQVGIAALAFSDRYGETDITIPLKDGWKPKSACGYLEGEVQGAYLKETVRLATLDGFVRANRVRRLDFIKCDVEGEEMKVFGAGRDTLMRFSPIIYCEVDKLCLDRRSISLRAVFDFLAGLGYAAYLPGKEGDTRKLALVDPGALTRDKAEYFFIPESRKERAAHLIKP